MPNRIVMGAFPFKGRPHRGETFSDLLENMMGRYVEKIFEWHFIAITDLRNIQGEGLKLLTIGFKRRSMHVLKREDCLEC